MKPDLSIIILNWNTKQLLLDCVESILQFTKELKFEIIVVDNNSSDGSAEAVRKKFKKKIKLIQNPGNLGFSAGNNPGLKAAKGRYLLLLNSDTKIDYDVFPKIIKWMDEHPKVGIVGPKLLNKDGSLQSVAGYLPNLWGIFCQQTLPLHQVLLQGSKILRRFKIFSRLVRRQSRSLDKPRSGLLRRFTPRNDTGFPFLKVVNPTFYTYSHPVGWVQGSCFFIRREVYEQIGGLDENIFMYVEETEYCKRATNEGGEIWYLADEYVWHWERGSSISGKKGAILGTYKGLKYYFKKHKPKWQLPVLNFLLKLGALLRFPLAPKVYWKAFWV